jgi:hypothetical protein
LMRIGGSRGKEGEGREFRLIAFDDQERASQPYRRTETTNAGVGHDFSWIEFCLLFQQTVSSVPTLVSKYPVVWFAHMNCCDEAG